MPARLPRYRTTQAGCSCAPALSVHQGLSMAALVVWPIQSSFKPGWSKPYVPALELAAGSPLGIKTQYLAQTGRFNLFSRNLVDMGGISSDLWTREMWRASRRISRGGLPGALTYRISYVDLDTCLTITPNLHTHIRGIPASWNTNSTTSSGWRVTVSLLSAFGIRRWILSEKSSYHLS